MNNTCGGMVSLIYEILLADIRVQWTMEGILLQTCVSPQHIDSEAQEEDAQQFVFQKALQVILMHKQVWKPLNWYNLNCF